MSRPSQRTQKPKRNKDKDSQEADTNTLTVTQVPLTKYITHKDFRVTQIGQKDSKKHKKIPPDKRHHKSKEHLGNMSVNPQNKDLINTQNNQLLDGETSETPVNTETIVNTENLQDQLSAMEQ